MPPEPQPRLRLCSEETPLERRDDDELMQLCAAGARAAFETLIRRHQAGLRAFCARRCGSGAGDDVAQETFVTVWQLSATYEPRGRFRAFLFTLAERRCRNVLRSSARFPAPCEPAAEPSLAATQLDALIAQERQRSLYRSVAKLSDEQQRALLLRFAGGLDYEEIAEIAKRPAATIRVRVFLALRRLRRLVRKADDL